MPPLSEKERSEKLAAYYALRAVEQGLMQLAAIWTVPLTADVPADRLAEAGLRDPDGRPFAAAALQAVLERLAGRGLLVHSHDQNAWRCSPYLSEPIVRHAVRDGRFERYARLFESYVADAATPAPGPAASLAAIRIAMHRHATGTFRAVLMRENAAAVRAANADGLPGVLWQLCANPFDAAWFQTVPPDFQTEILHYWLAEGFECLTPVDEAMVLLRDRLVRHEIADPGLAGTYATAAILRGRPPPDYLPLLANPNSSPPAAEFHAWSALVHGHDEEARRRYAEALAGQRRGLGRRRQTVLRGLPGLFHPLALLAADDPDDWREAEALVEAAADDDSHPYNEHYRYLRAAVGYRRGRLEAAGELPPPPSRPLSHLLFNASAQLIHALCRRWTAPDRPDPLEPMVARLARLAAAHGWRWYAREFAALAATSTDLRQNVPPPDAPEGGDASPATPPRSPQSSTSSTSRRAPTLSALLPARAGWELALGALERLGGENAAAANEAPKPPRARIVWQLTFGEDPGDIQIQPVEQTRAKNGRWSKGRNIALKRVLEERDAIPSFADQDRAVAATLRQQPVHYGIAGIARISHVFDLPKALLALCGHPLVFRADAPDIPFQVVRGEPELSLIRDGDELLLGFSPAWPADNAPTEVPGNGDGDDNGDEDGVDESLPEEARERLRRFMQQQRHQPPTRTMAAAPSSSSASAASTAAVVWRRETPTRLKVVELGPEQQRIRELVGAGLRLPAGARDRALAVAARLAGSLRVHSGLNTAMAEEVPADGRIWVHLVPSGSGMRAELLVHPFGRLETPADAPLPSPAPSPDEAESPAENVPENGDTTAGTAEKEIGDASPPWLSAETAPVFRPGEGGEVVFVDGDGRRLQTRRDLDDERRAVRRVLRACPVLNELPGLPAEGEWQLPDAARCLDFLLELQELGDSVVVAWPRGGKLKLRRVAGGTSSLSLAVRQQRDWFAVNGQLRVDENLTLDLTRLLALRRNEKGRFLALGDGEFLALTDSLRQQLDDLAALGEAHGDGLRLDALASLSLAELADEGAGLDADRAWQEKLQRYREARDYEAAVPATLQAELRDYQIDGFRWLARLARWGVGACLADDMGLGKTVQALALLLHRASSGPALVVAPMSVCRNWEAEARRFAPHLRVVRFGEGDRAGMIARLKPFDLVVASYGLLHAEDGRLAGVPWATVVLDEAQSIKNRQTKRSKAAMALPAGFRLITTGTPIENHLGELWNLFRFLNPGLLGSLARFNDRFANPIMRDGDADARRRLRKILRPFILRRTKAQVLDELPPRTEITLAVSAGPRERAAYEALRRDAVERLAGEANAPPGERRLRVLAEIMRLRRACCNPALVFKDQPPPSAKMEQFLELLDELLGNRHQALVFSQFVDHLTLIRRALDARGVFYQYLDGSTPARERQRAVEAFQRGEGDVFLISLKAGGLGLNLTAADYVIHMDPWWNPAVEDQASDRAHRIGQTRPVTVYRLVMQDTIEGRIVELHGQKRDLADRLLAGADQAARLDVDELLRLLRED